jgi:hypothetical protein
MLDILLGAATSEQISVAAGDLAAATADAIMRHGFCLLAGNAEYIRVPDTAMIEFLQTDSPVTFKLPPPWEPLEDMSVLPVQFMMGTDKFTLCLRPPIMYKTTEEGTFMTLHHIELPASFRDLIDAAGLLVGVGIHHDVREFEDLLLAVAGEKISFHAPVDLAVIARLAGYNLLHHSVSALALTFLGIYLPKNQASIGDGLWYKPLHELGIEYGHYIIGHIAQVFLTATVVIISWVFYIFPDIHAITKASLAQSAIDLLDWWVQYIIIHELDCIPECSTWTPVTSQAEAIPTVIQDPIYAEFHQTLVPDWPHITSGGCRCFHSARSWLFSRSLLHRPF